MALAGDCFILSPKSFVIVAAIADLLSLPSFLKFTLFFNVFFFFLENRPFLLEGCLSSSALLSSLVILMFVMTFPSSSSYYVLQRAHILV